MKVVEIQQDFGLDHLCLAERERPEPGTGEVLLRMTAAALNYRDLMMVEGRYNPAQPLPLIPCSDGVGEVVAIGPEVTRVAVGDRVVTQFCQGWISGGPSRLFRSRTLGGPLDGTLAEYMVLSEDGVVEAPAYLSDVEAATLTCAGLTAWSALATVGGVGEGDTVLVQGTGGVAIFALQFARLLGARVIATSSSNEKLVRARELGAMAGINYRETPKWAQAVKRITEGHGVDLVVDVGGATTLPQSIHAVRPGGQISLIGNLTGAVTDLDILPVFMRGIRIQGVLVGNRDGFEAMCRMMSSKRMRPVIDRVFAWSDVRTTFDYLASGRHFGKIGIRT